LISELRKESSDIVTHTARAGVTITDHHGGYVSVHDLYHDIYQGSLLECPTPRLAREHSLRATHPMTDYHLIG
jgi:hypothetical protein